MRCGGVPKLWVRQTIGFPLMTTNNLNDFEVPHFREPSCTERSPRVKETWDHFKGTNYGNRHSS